MSEASGDSREDRLAQPGSPDLGIDGLVDAVLVGRGGSGSVYRAVQPRLNRVVAVKVLDAFPDEALGLGRFEREAYAMGTVAGHPHIVTVHSVGTTSQGRLFLLMPYLDGGSLAEHVPMPWPAAVRQLIKICGAVETAHRAGVLHRDIKPGNILLSSYGEPLLADFGISRVSGGFETSEGLVNASIPYAPPEVLDGRPASVAGDVYSLGATLFCMITGHPPFAGQPGEPLLSTYIRIGRDPVPDLRPNGVPDGVCQVMESALAKDPPDRPRTVGDLGWSLQEAQRGTGQPVTPMTLTGGDTTTTRDIIPATRPDTAQPAPAREVADRRTATTTQVVTGGTAALQPRPLEEAGAHAATPGSRTRASAGPALQAFSARRRPASAWWIAAGALVLLVLGVGAAWLLWPRGETPLGADGADPLTVQRPTGIAAAADGTVYIADGDAHQVRRVSATGDVDTYVGTGEPGNTGNGRPATAASIEFPAAVTVDDDGTLYLATGGTVRQVDAQGIIRPVDGFHTDAGIIAVSARPDGTLYAANRNTLFIRTPDGTVDPLPGSDPEFGHIESIAVHPDGWVAVCDSARDQVIRLDPTTGNTEPVAGVGADASEPRDDGHPATASALSDPTGITVDRNGRLYVSEAGMNRVRTLQPDGTLLTVAGDPEGYSEGDGGDGGPGINATFRLLDGPLAVDEADHLLIGDVSNHRVRTVTPDGIVHPYPDT